jgi:hypothetical protein
MAHASSRRRALRGLTGVVLAAAMLAVVVPLDVERPEQAFQSAVAGALAARADDRLVEVALAQYPERAPAIVITYGHLDLFREQLARFGSQVVPIIAAYQDSLTTADALQIAGHALDSMRRGLGAIGAPTSNRSRRRRAG